MLAGRPHEAVSNGSPRWMAVGPLRRVHRTRPTGRLARRLTAAPSAVDRASSRCRAHPQWLIRARLWANLWMTCAYAPRICAQRGDNAVGFREAKPLATAATWAETLHTLCTGRNGNVSTATAASMHKMTESLSEVYLNVIRRENGGD
jgi:hypothetical protein